MSDCLPGAMGSSVVPALGRRGGIEGFARVTTPFGTLQVAADRRAIREVLFVGSSSDHQPEPGWREGGRLVERACQELGEYFAGQRTSFDLPVSPVGSDFDGRVWRALCAVPYGTTVSYGELAARIGLPRAARAVGGASHRNPIAILVPCHRVIGKDGSLVGYAGGLGIKQRLLALEQGQSTLG